MKKIIVLLLLARGLEANCAPFQNLGFDEADTNGVPSNTFGPAGPMLPGWKLFDEHGETRFIGYNADVIGLNLVVLYDKNYLNFGGPAPVEGKYALGLWPGPGLEVTEFALYHLTQIGEVPADAKTIHFVNFGSGFELLFNGKEVPLIYDYPPGGRPPRFNRDVPIPAVGDISAFAGQTVELEFITLSPFGLSDGLYGIESISFSPELIPESSTWALLALGGTCLLFRWRFLRSSVRVRRE